MGPRRPRQAVQPHADRALALLGAAYSMTQLCGSFRRGKAFVGDVDVVVSGKTTDVSLLDVLGPGFVSSDGRFEGIRKRFDFVGTGKQHPLSVDVWEVEPDKFGSAILHATGCARMNIHMQRWARYKGLQLTLFGVLRPDGSCVASLTEEDCFEALDMPFFKPEDRDGSYERLRPYLELMNGSDEEVSLDVELR